MVLEGHVIVDRLTFALLRAGRWPQPGLSTGDIFPDICELQVQLACRSSDGRRAFCGEDVIPAARTLEIPHAFSTPGGVENYWVCEEDCTLQFTSSEFTLHVLLFTAHSICTEGGTG